MEPATEIQKEIPKKRGRGRPPGRKSKQTLELEAAAREYTEDAFKALLHVAQKGKNETARITAATAILDRGWGKPRQAVELTGQHGGPIQIADTRAALASRIAGLASRIGSDDMATVPHTNGNSGA